MIGILLLTHTPLGNAFIEAATHVFHARPERLEAVDVIADQDPQKVCALAQEAIARLDDGSGVLVMTDIIGGTPSNCTLALGRPGRVEVIAGINLSMLLRALTYRNGPLEVVMEMAVSGGQSGIVRVDNQACFSPH